MEHHPSPRRRLATRGRAGLVPLALALALALAPASAGRAQPAGRAETAEPPDGPPVRGRLEGGPGGPRFVPEGGGPGWPLDRLRAVAFDGTAADPAADAPPAFHAELGLGQRISGRQAAVDADAVRLERGPGGEEVRLDRAGVLALVQRRGEAQVFRDPFASINESRWAVLGRAGVADAPRPGGEPGKVLRLPAGVAALTHRPADPVPAGRVELAFRDDARVSDGQQAFLDLQFRGPDGPETVRAILGWSDESLAVQTPGGPALAVQRLARREGWRQLSVRFTPSRTELAVDGAELARGRGPGGPLIEIRLATSTAGKGPPPADLAAEFAEIRLARFAEPVEALEVDPGQDEARGVDGDQLFGRVESAGPDGAVLDVAGSIVALPWSDVSGLHLRRAAAPGRPVEGVLARLQWHAGPGKELDAAEGALVDVADDALTLETPYAGTLRIPRDRVDRLEVLGRGRRLVLDPTPHHLGDEVSREEPRLDPPQPEGGVLELAFELGEAPEGPAELVLDVVQVVGEARGLEHSQLVRDGQIRTQALLNGKRFDYLNRHIATRNETPERVRLPIPPGLLAAGRNVLRLEQGGLTNDPNYLDDLGILGIALEFPAPAGPASP